MSSLLSCFDEAHITSRPASIVFGIASMVAIAFSAVWRNLNSIPVPTSEISNVLWAVCGSVGVLAIVVIWIGMWQFWKKCDRSSKSMKMFYFLLLTLGMWFGAIIYYLAVYLRRPRSKVACDPR